MATGRVRPRRGPVVVHRDVAREPASAPDPRRQGGRLDPSHDRTDVARLAAARAPPDEPCDARARRDERRDVGDDENRDEVSRRDLELGDDPTQADDDDEVGQQVRARPAGQEQPTGRDEYEQRDQEERQDPEEEPHRSIIRWRSATSAERPGPQPASWATSGLPSRRGYHWTVTLVGRGDSWQAADVHGLSPTVLILGGFLTAPPLYWPLRRRLLERGAAAVIIGNVWTPDWLLAGLRGPRAVATRAGRALLEAAAAEAAASRGAPVLVIGHSAGGVLARLLTSDEPFNGRRFGASRRIGAIVSLGSPHHVAHGASLGAILGGVGLTFLDRVIPGAAYAPCIGYVSVGSRAIIGAPGGTGRERVAYRLYQGFVSDPDASSIEGDGVVPVRSALLEGAAHLVLDHAHHGQGSGGGWYGDDTGLDAWWPLALDAWRSALRARQAGLPIAASRRGVPATASDGALTEAVGDVRAGSAGRPRFDDSAHRR